MEKIKRILQKDLDDIKISYNKENESTTKLRGFKDIFNYNNYLYNSAFSVIFINSTRTRYINK